MRSDAEPVAPGIGLPSASVTVTSIVSCPNAKPVVSMVPKSTWTTEFCTVSCTATGVEANSCWPMESVTTNDARSFWVLLTALTSVAETLTDVPGLAKGGVGVTVATDTNWARVWKAPVGRLDDLRETVGRRLYLEIEGGQVGGGRLSERGDDAAGDLARIERHGGLIERAGHVGRQAEQTEVVGGGLIAGVLHDDAEVLRHVGLGRLTGGRERHGQVVFLEGDDVSGEVIEDVAEAHDGGSGRRSRSGRSPAFAPRPTAAARTRRGSDRRQEG